MKISIVWAATLLCYGLLNYACVWMVSKPGLMTFFLWGTTLPVTAMATWGAILIPRRQKFRHKRLLGALTIVAYGTLGILSFWTVWANWLAV